MTLPGTEGWKTGWNMGYRKTILNQPATAYNYITLYNPPIIELYNISPHIPLYDYITHQTHEDVSDVLGKVVDVSPFWTSDGHHFSFEVSFPIHVLM